MSDREALEALYHAGRGERWHRRDNWLSDQPLGEWYGIRADEVTGRVWAIDLPLNGLMGTITPRLGELEGLIRLDLSTNSLEGRIPESLASCRKLQLALLQDNDLEGHIPEGIAGPRLMELALSNNRMEGPLPPGLGGCKLLRGLWLSGCSFSGPIPAGLAECAELRVLDLAHNEFSGEIPEALGRFQEFDQLYLAGNALTGGIPEGLWRTPHHDLEDLAQEMGTQITGHLFPGGLEGREVRVMTCPEWPSRELRMALREPGLVRGLGEGEMVWVLYTQDRYGNLWAENMASRAEKERGQS